MALDLIEPVVARGTLEELRAVYEPVLCARGAPVWGDTC